MAGGAIAGGGAAAAMGDRRRLLAFLSVLIAVALEVVDTTIVNTALPAIRASLDASSAQMQWIVAGYLLLLGACLLLGGRLGDALGHARVFRAGIALFIIASLLCGLARSADELIAARMLQGACAAIMAPQGLAIVQLIFTPLERVTRLAYFGLILGLAAILGPIVGGTLIDLDLFGLSWRVIFLINLPIGLVALALGWVSLPEAEARGRLEIDPVGVALFAAAIGGMLFALIEGAERGWSLSLALLLATAMALLAFGWRRARQREACGTVTIVQPLLFAIPTFRWATFAAFAFNAASIGFLLVFAVALQSGLGLSPLQTALVHIPFGAGVMLGVGFLVPRLLPRLGKRLPVAGGTLMLFASAAALHLIEGGDGGSAILLCVLALAGVGMGSLSGPLGPIVVADVEGRYAGTASATFRTAQQIGGASGIALVGGAYFALATGPDAALRGLLPAAIAVGLLLILAIAGMSMLPRRLFDRSKAHPADR